MLRSTGAGGTAAAPATRDYRESAFQLTTAEGALTLDVRVPEARIEVLDGLARQAEAPRAGAATGSGAIA